MKTADLELELNDIDEQLKSLSEKRAIINQQLRDSKLSDMQQRVEKWKLTEGTCLLFFAKTCSSFYIAKTVKITEIKDNYFYNICGEYFDALDDVEFRCHADKPISFTCLEELEKDYHIYIVDPVHYVLFIQQLCELKIHRFNISEYENTYKPHAERIIS